MSDATILADAIEKVVDEKIEKALRGGAQTVVAEYMGTDGEGKAWVVLPGASSATPVRRSSVEAAVGDTVSVTVGDGMAVIDANLTDKSAGMAGVAKVDNKATVAQETAVEAIDYASQAYSAASAARISAEDAQKSADTAQASANDAVNDASRANTAANQAISDAAVAAGAASAAQESADSAQASAESAQTSANKATYALSDVEKVVGTVNWIAEHGEYELTSDTSVDSSKTYYTRSGSSPNYTYTVVANPVASELSAYYELELDESVQNYIASHLWLDDYGLNLSVDSANGYRIHQGTVDGSHSAGTYIIDPSGNVVGMFSAGGAQIGTDAGSHVAIKTNAIEMADSSTKFLAIMFDGLVNVINSGGDPSVTAYTKADIDNVVSMLNDGYTVSDTSVLDPEGGATLYTLDSNSYVCNRFGNKVRSANYFIKYDTSGSTPKFKAWFVMSAQVDPDVVPTFISMGESSIHAGDGCIVIETDGIAEGHGTKATGGSHAEGRSSEASGAGSHAEGNETYAMGNYSHAEGDGTASIGFASHAEGYGVNGYGGPMGRADGDYSHLEGYCSNSGGEASHAEGSYTSAQGDNSHSQNLGTWAASDNQTAIGKYNIADDDDTYALIIGNGTADSDRSNALTVDWDGNVNCTSVNGVDMGAVGELRSASDSVSVATSTNANVASITLPAGTWVVNARLQFASNSTGRRAAKLSTTSQDDSNTISTDVRNAVDGGATNTQTERLFALSSQSTVYLIGWQNSGSTLSCTGDIQAVRMSPVVDGTYQSSMYGSGAYGMMSAPNTMTLTKSEQLVAHDAFTGRYCTHEDGGIKVANAGTYLVQGSMYLYESYGANDIVHAKVKVGDTVLIHSLLRLSLSAPYTIQHVQPTIAQLSAGDVVKMYAYNQSNARGTLRSAEGVGLQVIQLA